MFQNHLRLVSVEPKPPIPRIQASEGTPQKIRVRRVCFTEYLGEFVVAMSIKDVNNQYDPHL